MERANRQVGDQVSRQHAAQRKSSVQAKGGGFANWVNNSPAMTAQRKQLDGMFGSATQRVEEEKEPLQGRFESVQRVEEDKEPVQGRFETAQLVEEEPLQGRFIEDRPAQRKEATAKPNNTGLPDTLKSGIESLSGMSMDSVRVHYNSSQPAQLNALAYAQGTDIHVASGQEQHLPHEALHVVQQKQGRVNPTMQLKNEVNINDDARLEKEADVMGNKAMQMKATEIVAPVAKNNVRTPLHVVQRFWKDTDGEKTWVDDNLFLAAWYNTLTEEYIARTSRTKKGRLKKHRDTRNVKYWSLYHPKSRDVFRLKRAIASHINSLENWFSRLGRAKGEAIFTTFDMAKASERNLIAGYINSFEALSVGVVTGLMARNKADVSTFLNRLTPAQFVEYFSGDEAMQLNMVASNDEFSSLVNLLERQSNFDQGAVMGMNPTAYQGSHFLSEHGAYRSKHQTIHLALEYAHRTGGNQSTKGNWASHHLEKAAMDWALNQANLQIAAARAANTAQSSTNAEAGIQGSYAPIFGVPGTPTAAVANRVGDILLHNNWEHGAVSGSNGRAQVVLTGNFQHPDGLARAGAYAGTFRGRLAGAALANGATAANQAVRIRNVAGNGNVTTDIVATAVANKRLDGVIHGRIVVNNAQINMQLGAGNNTRYFDGVGNFTGMAAGDINRANTEFTYGYSQLSGKVYNQSLVDRTGGGGNSINNIKADVAGPNTGAMFAFGVGSNLTGNGNGYTPGLSAEIRSGVAGAKAQNLQADVTNHTGGNTFNPQSMQDIVNNATITGKPSTYVRVTNAYGATANFTQNLLAPNLMVTGTLANLQATYPGTFNTVTDLSSMTLQIDQLAKGNPRFTKNIDEVATPAVGTTYKSQIGGEWYSFRLAAYQPGPGQTNFRMLLYLKNTNQASYEVFTGYPC